MADSVDLYRPGSQEFTTLTFPCPCVRCGRPVRWISTDTPVGRSRWERRVTVQCVNELCRWTGQVAVTLTDLGQEPAGRAS